MPHFTGYLAVAACISLSIFCSPCRIKQISCFLHFLCTFIPACFVANYVFVHCTLWLASFSYLSPSLPLPSSLSLSFLLSLSLFLLCLFLSLSHLNLRLVSLSDWHLTFKCQISSQLYLGFSFRIFSIKRTHSLYPLPHSPHLLWSCHLALSLELSNCVAKLLQVAQLLLLQLLQLLSAACNEWKTFRNAEFNDDSAKDIRVEFEKKEGEG